MSFEGNPRLARLVALLVDEGFRVEIADLEADQHLFLRFDVCLLPLTEN